MPASSPLAEKRQMSAAVAPVGGRASGIGLPASEQELLATEKTPRAAMSRSTSLFGLETPAVVGSTTTMSWATADWEPLVSGMGVSEIFCATVMRETMFDVELSGLRTWT